MIIDLKLMEKTAESFGFRLANSNEVGISVHLCEHLTGLETASAVEALAVQNVTGCSLWVYGNPISGFYYIMPLSADGEQALRDGSFNPRTPAVEHLTCPAGDCAGLYIGIYAGATHEARKAIMTASAVIRMQLFGTVPCYARGATEDGRRSMSSLGFSPVEGGLPELWGQPALITCRVA